MAAGVTIDIRANGDRVQVRNHRAEDILVLDMAMEPDRDEESGVLAPTYVRPGRRN